MINKILKKTASVFLIMIFTISLFPLNIYAQQNPFPSLGEIKGFNRSVLDSHFSRADRELNPDRWLDEAKHGMTQAVRSWELTAEKIYTDTASLNEAKINLEKLSNEELEKRFSKWLLERFFGEAVQKAITEFHLMFDETQKNYSWHLDEDGNIIFDDITGDPMVIRPGADGREFSEDLVIWNNEAKDILNSTANSFENAMIRLYPELLSYVPAELRETAGNIIHNAYSVKANAIKMEFENLAAREESIFSNRRTRDIWSLRKKSEDQSAWLFTEKLIAETGESCKAGIEELKTRIEQASAGTGDLAVLGEEWLRLYKEQFDRGLKAWEEAEERFFIRRIEWEQESYRFFSEGEAMWSAAFNQFEEERQKWELNAKELFLSGELMFKDLSDDFNRNIAEAKKEFELNITMRIGEGTAKIKATIDMYLICASAAITAMDNVEFWHFQYNVSGKASPDSSGFSAWLSGEIKKKPNNKILQEMQKSYNLYASYMANAVDARNRINESYSELLGTGALKDILLPGATSGDFCLDEYQIALIRAKALVLYWENKTAVAEAVMNYAGELGAGRMTEAEGIRAWEESKTAYNASLADYEAELKKLYEAGGNIQKQQEILNKISSEMQKEEEKLNLLNQEYKNIISVYAVNQSDYLLTVFNDKYILLSQEYNKILSAGRDSYYITALEYGMMWGIAEQRDTAQRILNILETENDFSAEERAALYNEYYALDPEAQKKIWNDTCDSLSLLFDSYGIKSKNGVLPDIKTLCDVLFTGAGNFTRNAANFLQSFDNCFLTVPQWLDIEITSWKNSLVQYITAYALYKGIDADKNSSQAALEQEKLMAQYNDLYNYAVTLDSEAFEEENIYSLFIEIRNKILEMNYIYQITLEREYIKTVISSGSGKHWRQYLRNDYIFENDPDLVIVSSYQEGLLADALFMASYFTNRVNDSFAVYSQRDLYNTDAAAGYYFSLYREEFSKDVSRLGLLADQYADIAESVKVYELSKLTPSEIENKKNKLENDLTAQNNIYGLLLNEYLLEAEKFMEIGILYDAQYSVINKAYENTEQKRLEYEKQDAIRRWASTSYLNIDNNELINANEKLLKAQTVLNILSDLYSNESRRSYDNPEYNALYSAYEESFSRKFLVQEAAQSILSAITQEYINNANIFENYKKALNQLGHIDQNYNNYVSSSSRTGWTIKDVITLKDGRIVFSKDASMRLSGINEAKSSDLKLFFNTMKTVGYEGNEISLFEESLLGLSQRMSGYLSNSNKFKQWSLARDYLITSLINANGDLYFLNNYFSGLGQMKPGSPLYSLTVKQDTWFGTQTLGSRIGGDYLFTYQDYIIRDAWYSLSETERADLEYYVILTLTGNKKDYYFGFSQYYTQDVYNHAYDYVNGKYWDAKNVTDNPWLFFISWAWYEMRDINYEALKRIDTVLNETKRSTSQWISGLRSNFSSINKLTAEYAASCQKITALEGVKTSSSYIVWADINQALLNTGKLNNAEIEKIKACWELMYNGSGIVFTNVVNALNAMIGWTTEEELRVKSSLDKIWTADMQNQQMNDLKFQLAADDYNNGRINADELRIIAESAYGNKAAAWKNHIDNLQTVMLSDISLYLTADFNFYPGFGVLGGELTVLAENTLENKYTAELAAREIEWNLTLNDIKKKYYEWQDNAALILENGRTDWITSFQKMEQAYKQWSLDFRNEYERVSGEWQQAYFAGLEDKEKWLLQAANAANQASSEYFLTLIGAEGERLARFLDTREPFGIRGSIPQTQTLLAEALQSSGIINMAGAFGSFNNLSGTISGIVKTGISGTFTWDAALVKTAAYDLARKSNAEIEENEVKKLAYNVNAYAQEAVKSLAANIDSANKNFRSSMDDHFIFNGLWRRSGNSYVKDIIKGSALFTPVITETVTVAGYKNFILQPITLRTNLDEDYLANLNSIAVRGLLENALSEISDITDKIFGIGESSVIISGNGENRVQSPGLFGAHIGYSPAVKPSGKMGTNRAGIFLDEGTGELGRLMSEYIYWTVIDTNGTAELSFAPWDKRIWNDDGSWLQSPSLRTVGAITGTIAASIAAGAVTGGAGFAAGIAVTAAIASTSEIVFGSLDAAFGFKTLDEAAFNIGKSILTNTASGLMSGVFGGFGGSNTILGNGLTKTAMSTAEGTAGKILTQTMMKGLQTFSTGVASSMIGAVTYSSADGFGYSANAFRDGISGVFTNTLSSMASVFTAASLTAVNSGLDMNKLTGFSRLNQNDLQKLNGLLGSIAGQGVNYAMGEDFTLNVLNLSQLTGGKYNSGLLELRIGDDGVSMNIGTGGADISVNNLIASIKGAAVWNVNSRIFDFGSNNDFDALIALRALYGYGDDKQRSQLWDILNGGTIINTEAEGSYYAQTIIDENSKRLINLAGYENGLSPEDQFRLAVILGHEAYRDGYSPGDYNESGNIENSLTNFFELKDSSIARLAMADRINAEHDWFYNANADFDFERYVLLLAEEFGDPALYDIYLLLAYNNDEDFFFLTTETRGDYQNQNAYKNILLFNAYTQDRLDQINQTLREKAYSEYLIYEEYYRQGRFTASSYNEFINNSSDLKKFGYNEMNLVTLYLYGCKFMTAKYMIEAIQGAPVNALQLHDYVKENKMFTSLSLLSDQNMADIITKYTEGSFSVTTVDAKDKPDIGMLYELEQSLNMYTACLMVDNGKGGDHFVALSEIVFDFDNDNNLIGIKEIHAANPWNSQGVLGKQTYSYQEIKRWDLFIINPVL